METDRELLEDVLKYLAPHFKYIVSLMIKKDVYMLKEIKKGVQKGLEKGKISFPADPNLDIDLNKIKKEKSKEWVDLLIHNLNEGLLLMIESGLGNLQ